MPCFPLIWSQNPFLGETFCHAFRDCCVVRRSQIWSLEDHTLRFEFTRNSSCDPIQIYCLLASVSWVVTKVTSSSNTIWFNTSVVDLGNWRFPPFVSIETAPSFESFFFLKCRGLLFLSLKMQRKKSFKTLFSTA